jgi:hypothetical protein
MIKYISFFRSDVSHTKFLKKKWMEVSMKDVSQNNSGCGEIIGGC